ncbi:MAG: Lmo0850 family protein [Bacillus sp. (in: firmicutes)]
MKNKEVEAQYCFIAGGISTVHEGVNKVIDEVIRKLQKKGIKVEKTKSRYRVMRILMNDNPSSKILGLKNS